MHVLELLQFQKCSSVLSCLPALKQTRQSAILCSRSARLPGQWKSSVICEYHLVSAGVVVRREIANCFRLSSSSACVCRLSSGSLSEGTERNVRLFADEHQLSQCGGDVFVRHDSAVRLPCCGQNGAGFLCFSSWAQSLAIRQPNGRSSNSRDSELLDP